MKNIAVLVDYTEGCKKALNQARILAELAGSEVHAIHVTSKDINETENARLMAFATEEVGLSIPVTGHLFDGRLMTSLIEGLKSLNPDLVVMCTHGVKGIVQHLFGARVLALVQAVDNSFLIVHENSEINERGLEKILFPATHSSIASVLIHEVMNMAAECDSEVV